MHRFAQTAAALLAASASFLVPGVAIAQDVPVRAIHRADLDLGTAQGRRVLRQRIASATEAVCGSYAGASAEEEARITQCRASVADQVARQTGIEALARR